MLNNTRLSFKLIVMAAIAAAGIAAVAAVGLTSLRSALLADRKEKLEQLVHLAGQALERDRQASLAAGLSDDQAKQRGKALLASFHFGTEDYFYALDMNGVLVVHPSRDFINKSVMDSVDADGVAYGSRQIELVRSGPGAGFVDFRFPRAGVGKPLPKIVYVTAFKPYDWIIAGGIYVDDIDEIFWERLEKIGALIAATLALVLGMSVMVGRSITGPVAALTGAMRKLAAGDTETLVPATRRGDEVGAMAKSVQVFKDAMIESAELRREQARLQQRAKEEKKEFMARMADDFERSVSASLGFLSDSAVGMCSMSQGMSETARGASQRATIVSSAAEEASSNVQAVASATEELSNSITEISAQVLRATDVAGRAVEEAGRTNQTVHGLAEAATKIGDVVQLISDIAAQTNLLALNATIEAARAGEAGKGFAVVADEVKTLAGQTARATGEISAQIAAMQGATSEAVRAIGDIGQTIAAISEISTVIAAAVEEQDAATREIARNVSQAAQGTSQVSSNIGGVNEAAGQTGEAAGNVRTAAEEVSRQTETLQDNVVRFLTGIREAA